MTDFMALLGAAVLIGFVVWAIPQAKKRDEQRAKTELASREIICPNMNCGYKGPAKKTKRGSTVIGLLLCFFFLIPGIIYFIVKSGHCFSCPKCGVEIRTES